MHSVNKANFALFHMFGGELRPRFTNLKSELNNVYGTNDVIRVNYFDQEIITQDDNPIIGLVLCTEKSEAMVKYTLGDKAKQIFASKYQFHLPIEAELKRELQGIQGQLNKSRKLRNK